MKPSDKPAFLRALVGAAEIHAKKLSPEQIALYWSLLEQHQVEVVVAAIERHMADPDVGMFMPKPADIIRQIAGTSDSRAMLAWSKVERAVRCVGSYQTVAFDDWRIHAVVRDMGGWIRLCETSEDDKPFRAREFEKRYRGYRDHDSVGYPRALLGRAEAANIRSGHRVDPPVLIGDQRQAALVYSRGADSEAAVQIGTLVAALLPHIGDAESAA